MTTICRSEGAVNGTLPSAVAMKFLSAEWRHLILANYPAPDATLAACMPPGCVPDTSLDGRAYVSLVAFDFLKTRVLGVPWPGFRNFPEINLRAYVRHAASGDRGVVFVRELVPQRFVALMARLTYNEPYSAVPMHSRVTTAGPDITVAHRATLGGVDQHISLTASAACFLPPSDGPEAFFKEHRWGFNRSRGGHLLRYEVLHPEWRCHKVLSTDLRWNFAKAYGPEWDFLNHTPPASVLLAEGSKVEVKVWGRERSPAPRTDPPTLTT